MCVLTENSLSLQQTDYTWPARPLVVVHYLNCNLLFTRYHPFHFLNAYVAILEKKNVSLFVFPQLETKFKDNANKTMTEREEPFRCLVKFSSTNLLESFRHCASTGMNNYFATDTTELFRKIFMHNFFRRYVTVVTVDIFKMTTRWRISH